MNREKNHFFRKYPHTDNAERERKWRLHQEEQEHLRLLEQFQMIQAENAQFFSFGAVSGGGSKIGITLTYSDLDYTPVQFDSLDAWNSHFNLPNNGPAFTEIQVTEWEADPSDPFARPGTIKLIGQPGITARNELFSPEKTGDQYLTSIVDTGCVTGSIGDRCFSNSYDLVEVKLPYSSSVGIYSFIGCNSLSILDLSSAITVGEGALSYLQGIGTISLPSCTTLGAYSLSYGNVNSVYLPLVQTVGYNAFAYCEYLLDVNLPSCTSISNYAFYGSGFTHLSIPLCTNLGGSEGDDSVFYLIYNRTITLTVNPYLLTNNSGDPDGDILYLIDPNQNNTVTIN